MSDLTIETLLARRRDVLISETLDKCFEEDWFTICPLNALAGFCGSRYDTYGDMRKLHCVKFSDFQDDEIELLRSLTKEVIKRIITKNKPKKPWYKFFGGDL